MTTDAVVIPLKSFATAKDRLRGESDVDVTALARRLARAVIEASRPRQVVVVCEDDDVARFARDLGADVVTSHARDLNEAVQGAYTSLEGRFERLVVAHGDLRRPQGLGRFRPGAGVTIVTDHHGEGTNVLVVPTGVGYRFAYGAGSRARHVAEAKRLGLSWRVVEDSPWRFDVDVPDDLTDAD